MPSQELIVSPELPSAVAITSASTDAQLLDLWVRRKQSAHSRRNFERTAKVFLDKLGRPLRGATLEEVEAALVALCEGLSAATARQYTLRVKSLLSFATKVRYLPFDIGAPITAPRAPRSLAKRILQPIDVHLLLAMGQSDRDYLLMAVSYAVGMRVSEVVGLNISDVLPREVSGNQRVQLTVLGKGQKLREVLLPLDLTLPVLALCGGRPAEAPLFLSRKGARLTANGAWRLVKRLAAKADINPGTSPHWLRHAHISHALQNGAPIPEVQHTVGHDSMASTSIYAHALPNTSSGDRLDASVWRRRPRAA
jgi:integrase/recombinase XerD